MYYHPEYTDIRRTVNISKPLRKHHIETLISDIEKVKNENLEYYMGLPYNMEIIPMKDYDNSIYYVARYKELDGLEGVGETQKKHLWT